MLYKISYLLVVVGLLLSLLHLPGAALLMVVSVLLHAGGNIMDALAYRPSKLFIAYIILAVALLASMMHLPFLSILVLAAIILHVVFNYNALLDANDERSEILFRVALTFILMSVVSRWNFLGYGARFLGFTMYNWGVLVSAAMCFVSARKKFMHTRLMVLLVCLLPCLVSMFYPSGSTLYKFKHNMDATTDDILNPKDGQECNYEFWDTYCYYLNNEGKRDEALRINALLIESAKRNDDSSVECGFLIMSLRKNREIIMRTHTYPEDWYFLGY